VKNKNRNNKKDEAIRIWPKDLANFFIGVGLCLLFLIFVSPLFQEMKYRFRLVFNLKYAIESSQETNKKLSNPKNKILIPVSTDFGIVIPKIGANARIFPNIDPFNEKEFLPILKLGVAHAKNTSFPGQGKNIYLFAHSTDDFYRVGQYNAVFYLIGKLIPGDEVDIFYKEQLFKYSVYEKKVVSPGAVNYLGLFHF